MLNFGGVVDSLQNKTTTTTAPIGTPGGYIFFSHFQGTRETGLTLSTSHSNCTSMRPPSLGLVVCGICFVGFCWVCVHKSYTPKRRTWNLKITQLKRTIIFQAFIFGFHVSFRSVYYHIQVWQKAGHSSLAKFQLKGFLTSALHEGISNYL